MKSRVIPASEPAPIHTTIFDHPFDKPHDFGEIKGLEAVKRAMTVALAGSHSIVLFGPAGCGKTMMRTAAAQIDERLVTHEVLIFSASSATDASEQWQQMRHDLAVKYDMHIEVPRVPFQELVGRRIGTATAAIRERVQQAREFNGNGLGLDEPTLSLLKQAYQELLLSPSAIVNIVRIARSIANLDAAPHIECHHIAEAVQYRLFDREYNPTR